MLYLSFISCFPEPFPVFFEYGILKKIRDSEDAQLHFMDLKEYAKEGPTKHACMDDAPYGGGAGRVLRIEPLVAAVEAARARVGPGDVPSEVWLASPKGAAWNQESVRQTTCRFEDGPLHLILVSGRYRGVDQRFVDHVVDREFRVGEAILSSGDLPLLVVAESLGRYLPGVVGNEANLQSETFSQPDFSEEALYTRPPSFRGWDVPEVLRSGDHARIEAYRLDLQRDRLKKTKDHT